MVRRLEWEFLGRARRGGARAAVLDIPDEEAEKIQTVKDAIDYIEKHLSS